MTSVWQASVAPAVFAIVFLLAQLADAAGFSVGFCAVRAVTDLPCPGCGLTTGMRALFAGDLGGALRANPATPFVLLFAVAQLGLAYAGAARHLPPRTVVWFSGLNDRTLLVSLLLVWIIRFI